jgi:hypothetical protein
MEYIQAVTEKKMNLNSQQRTRGRSKSRSRPRRLTTSSKDQTAHTTVGLELQVRGVAMQTHETERKTNSNRRAMDRGNSIVFKDNTAAVTTSSRRGRSRNGRSKSRG